MDTHQLAAFCAVVERRSFSQAAEQLGVTQPAVSLQIRSLEKRLGLQLLDRSGRRVEPTEAGRRLYRGAQRLLALEEQLLAELGEDAEGELTGRLEIGASTGPGGTVLPVVLAEFQQLHPGVHVALTVSDTQRVVEQVARRELELGVVGAARRHRGVVFEPFFRDEVVLAVPRGHRVRGPDASRSTSCKAEPLVLMQEGAGVRQMIDDELRERRRAAARPRRAARARPAGVGAERGARRLRRDVHLALGDRGRPRGGHARARARRGARAVAGDLARALRRPRGDARRAGVRRVRARSGSRDRPLGPRRAAGGAPRPGLDRPLLVASPRWDSADRGAQRAGPRCRRERIDDAAAPARAATASSPSAAAARSTSARRSRPRPALPLVSVPTTYAGAEWTTYFGVRDPERRMRGGGAGAHPTGDRLRAAS